MVTLRDITARHVAAEARFEAEAKYRSLVEHIPAVVYLDPVDPDQSSIYVSPQVRDLLGIEPAQWLEDPYVWRDHVHPQDFDRAWEEYEDAYNAHRPLSHEYRMVHEDGTIRWVLEQAFPIDDEAGDPWLIQGVIFDITKRKEAEEEVVFLAYHDKLTGLPNRHLFEEMLEAAIARARRYDLGVGVLFLDLDNFKLVNDSLGHHAGDLLLAQLADRLRLCTRETDTVARQGGDEFLVLLADLERAGEEPGSPDPGMEIAESVATRVREALEDPFDLNGTPFHATGSIGISLFPQDAADADTLMRNADHAMYVSKNHEPGGFVDLRRRGPRRDPAAVAHEPAPGGRPTGALGPALAAHRRRRDRRDRVGRGLDPLGRRARWPRGTRRVHPARRRARSDRGHRRMGDRGAGPSAGRVEGSRRRPAGGVQPVPAADVVGASRRQDHDPAPERRRRSPQRRGRDHRVHGDGRPRSDAADPLGAARVGASGWRSTTSGRATRRSRVSSTCRSTS